MIAKQINFLNIIIMMGAKYITIFYLKIYYFTKKIYCEMVFLEVCNLHCDSSLAFHLEEPGLVAEIMGQHPRFSNDC